VGGDIKGASRMGLNTEKDKDAWKRLVPDHDPHDWRIYNTAKNKFIETLQMCAIWAPG